MEGPHIDIAVLVEGRRYDSTAIFIEEGRDIRTPAKERHPEWCFCDYHIYAIF